MKSSFLLLLLGVLIGHNTNAQEIVWKKSMFKKLSNNFHEGPHFLKQRLRTKRIKKSFLRKPISPFYQDGGRFYRNYRGVGHKCYKVFIGRKKSIAYKRSCTQLMSRAFKLTTSNGETFTQVRSLNGRGVPITSLRKEVIEKKKINAFHHTSWHILEDFYDTRIIKFPYSSVEVELSKTYEFASDEKKLAIKSTYNLSRSAYTFLRNKNESVNTKHTFSLENDFVLQNEQKTKLVLYKTPKTVIRTFQDSTVKVNDHYLDHLNTITELFYDDRESDTRACFRDNPVRPHKMDCDYLIFKYVPFYQYKKFSFIEVDLKSRSLKFND